ncbi:hypothetical protein ON010_g5703 [Phytophthora cinnamomi]|nr:hypothetical protein ON010_g5703 [Phytophthora cinnamomi]
MYPSCTPVYPIQKSSQRPLWWCVTSQKRTAPSESARRDGQEAGAAAAERPAGRSLRRDPEQVCGGVVAVRGAPGSQRRRLPALLPARHLHDAGAQERGGLQDPVSSWTRLQGAQDNGN